MKTLTPIRRNKKKHTNQASLKKGRAVVRRSGDDPSGWVFEIYFKGSTSSGTMSGIYKTKKKAKGELKKYLSGKKYDFGYIENY